MANWTVVEGILVDGQPMRAFLAEIEGTLWAASIFDDMHPKSLAECEFGLGPGQHRQLDRNDKTRPVLREAARQVAEYFGGKRKNFDVPLGWRGTPFQNRVWSALREIPFASVKSYGEVAEMIGAFGASRAVGGANGRNFLPLFVPCQRVIAAGGKLGGYTGGLGLKRRLLAHEAAVAGVTIPAALAAETARTV
jgi:O-6-methylguanine DNA methyltransferase